MQCLKAILDFALEGDIIDTQRNTECDDIGVCPGVAGIKRPFENADQLPEAKKLRPEAPPARPAPRAPSHDLLPMHTCLRTSHA